MRREKIKESYENNSENKDIADSYYAAVSNIPPDYACVRITFGASGLMNLNTIIKSGI